MVTHAGPPIAVRGIRGAAGPSRLFQRWLASRAAHRETSAGARPALVPGERIVDVEVDRRGVPVVATDRGIYHRGGGGWVRLGWEQIHRVDWDNQRGTLMLRGLTPNVPSTVVLLSRGCKLVALARERVAWCILPVAPTQLDGVGTLLALRRQPGTDRLVWLVAFQADVDRDDPVTSARLASALHRLRTEAGV